MLLDDLESKDNAVFPSPDLLSDVDDLEANQCVDLRNSEYLSAQTKTRRGFARVISISGSVGAVRTMYNWVQQQANRLVYLNSSNQLIAFNLTNLSAQTLLTSVTSAGASFIQAGYRLFTAFFDTSGNGTDVCRIWDGTVTSSNANMDRAFRTPMYAFEIAAGTYSGGATTWGTLTASAGGAVTPGQHAFGLVITAWNGYQTSLGPIFQNGGTGGLVPYEFATILETATTGQQITLSVTPKKAWPSWANTVQLAMTTVLPTSSFSGNGVAAGVRWFLVPNSSQTLTRSSTTTLTFTALLSDQTLLGNAQEITNTLLSLYATKIDTSNIYTISGGTLTSIVVASNVGTVTTSTANGQYVGAPVSVTGCSTAALNNTYYVVSIVSSTVYTIATVGVGDGTYNNAGMTVASAKISGPFSPHHIASISNRAVYVTRTLGPDGTSMVGTLFVSEQFQPQYITAGRHLLNLPEFRDIVTGFALGSNLYALGPNWTYSWTDNLSYPVSWAPPRLVSGQIGSPFIHGVSANQSKGYAWVADHTGLFFFNGADYTPRSSSYQVGPIWDRINFGAAANEIKVIEVPEERLVIVKAPIDGATSANYLLVWDYTNGVTFDRIRFCGLWNIASYTSIGDIEVVQDPNTKSKQFWVSSLLANSDIKRMRTVQDGDAASPLTLAANQITTINVTANVATVVWNGAVRDPGAYVGATITVAGSVTTALNGTYTLLTATASNSTFATSGVANGSYNDVGLTITFSTPTATLYVDSGVYNVSVVDQANTGIDSSYSLMSFCGAAKGVFQQICGRFRITGNGNVGVTAKTFDQTRSIALVDIPATLTPGRRYDRFYDMQSEAVTYTVTNKATAGSFYIWSALRTYFRYWAGGR